jgi:RNA polymerase sigma-70 factor (ECF subfamily)
VSATRDSDDGGSGAGRRGRPRRIRLPDPPGNGRRRRLADCSDEELVVRYLEGDAVAFRVLTDRHHDRVVNFLTRKVGDRAQAEDLAQEAFLRVYRHLHRFDPEKTFTTWLYTIAGNLAKNAYRDRSRDPLVLFRTLAGGDEGEETPLQWADETYLPDDMARKRALQQTVEEVVEDLPAHHRTVFVLREMEGKSYEEIAEITGLKLGTVKSRLSRARNRFAEIASRRLGEPLAA